MADHAAEEEQTKTPPATASQRLWVYSVNLVVLFVVDILSHPLVQDAISAVLIKTVTCFISHPDFSDLLARISKELNYKDTAREMGHQLPGMAKQFVSGAVSEMVIRGKVHANNARRRRRSTSRPASRTKRGMSSPPVRSGGVSDQRDDLDSDGSVSSRHTTGRRRSSFLKQTTRKDWFYHQY